MKTTFFRRSFTRLSLRTACAAVVAGKAFAFTWSGGGGDDNWGTGANWVGGSSPSTGTGTQINFAGSTRLTPFFNYTPFDQMGSIFFDSGAGAFVLGGNSIKIFSKIENSSTTLQTVSFSSIVLNGTTATEINPVSGDLVINSALILDTPQLRVFGNNGKTVTFNGVISTGAATLPSVSINENSTVVFGAANTYTGDTFINVGKLQFAAGGSANNSAIRIGDTTATAVNTEVDLTPAAGGLTLSSVFNSRAGNSGAATIASQNTSGTNTLSGHLALDKALTITQSAGGTLNITQAKGADTTTGFDIKGFTQTFTPAALGTINVSGTVYNSAGSGIVAMNGAGTLILGGANTFTGGTSITAGSIQFSADNNLGASASGVSLNGGTLALRSSGTVIDTHVITVGASGGTIDTGNQQFHLNSTGLLTGAGALTVSGSPVGSLRISFANTGLTGTTLITSGALVENQFATGLGSSAITVNSGGELVASNITMADQDWQRR